MRTRVISAFVAVVLIPLLVACGGHVGSGGPQSWQYTAMGDSLAFGILDTQGGYVQRYRTYIQTDTGNTLTLTNLGQNGWHSGDLLNALKNDANFRNAVSSAQVVTWDIGGDDLLHAINQFENGTCGGADNQDCMRSTLATFMPNWDAIITEILALRSKSNTVIRTMDIYNPFVARLMIAGQFNTVEPYLDQVNAHIAQMAAANGIPMAQVHLAFNGPNGTDDPGLKGLLSIDDIHPNDAGHKAIADAFRVLGYSPLR